MNMSNTVVIGGELCLNLDKVSLYLCDEQKSGLIEGNKLYKKLKDQPVLDACVLEYLLGNPQLIPEEWKGKHVFFWGTIHPGPSGDFRVRCLYYHEHGNVATMGSAAPGVTRTQRLFIFNPSTGGFLKKRSSTFSRASHQVVN